MSSTFEVPVVAVKLRPHPNADTLSLVDVFGWQVVVKTEEWRDGDSAAFIRPDSIVPDTPQWAWLEGKRRIKTRRFRGEWSQGLLVLAFGFRPGDDVAAEWGIVAYEPPAHRERRSTRQRPKSLWARLLGYLKELGTRPRGRFPYYDVEHLRRYTELIKPGDEVWVTEKIHGANALYVYRKPWLGRARIFSRSRTVWKWPWESNWWKTALEGCPALRLFLEDHPGLTVYGEVYGPGIQDLTYGVSGPTFAAFDIWIQDHWMPIELSFPLLMRRGVPTVPVLYCGPYTPNLLALANNRSELAPHLAEGIVVRKTGREKVQLKVVSDLYLERTT